LYNQGVLSEGFFVPKAAWIIVVVMLGALGGYLAVGSVDNSMGRSCYQDYLTIMDQQLASLKVHLRKFKESRGRYPSTDEGLGVLNNYAARMKITMFRHPAAVRTDDLYGFHTTGSPMGWPGFWEFAGEKVSYFHSEHGHVPRTLAEMRQAWGSWDMTLHAKAPGDCRAETVERELAIGHDDTVLLIGPAGVLSPWQMPYVYENRRGASKAAFTDSPVERYFAGRYSVKVDDGIYLWSVGAQQYADEYHTLWLEAVITRCIAGVLILTAVVLIWRKIRGRARTAAVAGLIVSTLAGAASTRIQYATCYMISAMFSHRDPAMVSRRVELLDKYRAAGAISDETYDKSLESMGLKPGQHPATRPDEEK
jgi:hypothetical protein